MSLTSKELTLLKGLLWALQSHSCITPRVTASAEGSHPDSVSERLLWDYQYDPISWWSFISDIIVACLIPRAKTKTRKLFLRDSEKEYSAAAVCYSTV